MDVSEAFNADAEDDSFQSMYLLFNLKEESYGIQIGYVIEIVGMQKIVNVPDVPAYVKGVINLRGQVIPVVDVRSRFGIAERDYDDRTVIIVVERHNVKTGFIVDGVSEVVELLPEEVSPPPQSGQKRHSLITGVGQKGEKICFLLSLERMLVAQMEALTDTG